MTDCKYKSSDSESKIVLSIYAIGIPALLYFLGWMTLYYYLGYFGVYLFSTDIPFHFFIIYSFSVIKYIIFFIKIIITSDVFIVVLVLFSIILLAAWKFLPGKWEFLTTVRGWICTLLCHSAGAVATLFILFLLGHQASKMSGISLAKALRTNTQPLVKVHLKPSLLPNKKSAYFSKPNPFNNDIQFDVTKRITVLFATKDKYFFLIQKLPTKDEINTSNGASPGYRPEASVVEIRANEIKYLTTKLEEMVP